DSSDKGRRGGCRQGALRWLRAVVTLPARSCSPVPRMPPRSAVLPRLALAAAVAVLALHVPDASAQSKRDRAAASELGERMAAAESRYREALVKAANADPEAIAQGDAALEDMEDVMLAC